MVISLGTRKFSNFVALLERNSRTIIAILVTLVILSGVVYSVYLGDALRFLPDEQDYYDLATNVAFQLSYSLDGENPTAYRPPGYPLFLSIFRYLGTSVVILRILNFLIFGLGIYLVYKTLQKEYSPLAGLIGAFLLVAYPVVFFTSGTLYPQILASVAFLLIFYLYTRNSTRSWLYITCGVLFGFLILTIPTFIFVLFLFPVWLGPKRMQVKGYLIMSLTALALVAMWGVRNYYVFDDFIFVSTNSGENLLLGNSENTTPSGGRTIDISQYTSEVTALSEVERDQYYRSEAIEFIRNNKARTVQIYLLKVLNYFNYRNELVTRSEDSQIRDLIMLFTYGSLLILFVLRLFMGKVLKISYFERILIILYISSAFFTAVFFTRIRFRIPYDFFLIMIVALFLAKLARRYILKSQSQLVSMSNSA